MRLKSIHSKILLSHITIILISLFITAIVFNLSISAYFKNQAKSQLVTAAHLVEKSLDKNFPVLETEQKLKTIAKINKTLKQAQLYFNINYAFLTKDSSIVYPQQDDSEYTLLQQNILPLIEQNKLNLPNAKKPVISYIKVTGKPYGVTFYPLQSNQAVLVIYSDLSNQTKAVFTINLILFAILIITAFIAVAISNKLSKNISEPIFQLSIYAQKIGDRLYDVPSPQLNDKELTNLAETMKTMANKLSAYDYTIKSFVQNASHELRTPLMSIQGYAEGIKYGVIEDQSNAIEIIIEESKRLSNLVEDLLYLTKVDSPKEDLILENTNVEHLLRNCLERISGLLVKTNLEVILSCPKDLIISIDEEKTSRAIINILANAIRHAKSKIAITVTADKEQLLLEISDDGEGINDKDLPHIFERFYKGVSGNYGLGLTIAKTIIEKHRGTITVSSIPDSGATFLITLP
jgi:signal transduction histidine kinase